MFYVPPVFLASLLALSDLNQPQEFFNRPFAELIEITDASIFSKDELKAIRSRLEADRDNEIERSKEAARQLKAELSVARRELEALNEGSSVDSEPVSRRRSELHEKIANLEPRIQQENRRHEESIPESYDMKLAKLWLVEHWPEKLEEVLQRIDEGEARQRRHGDVEDIGYRTIVKLEAKDFQVGEQAARQMAVSGTLPLELADPGVQGYVRNIASKLAANSDLKVPLRVTVLDDTRPRAIGLPGGFLYVTTGVLHTARSESELAGVLSLEIARIAARHATRSSTRSLVARMVLPVAQIATGLLSGGMGAGAYYGVGYGVQGLDGVVGRAIQGTSGRYQKEADQLAVQYTWKAGFDPKGLVAFLDALLEQEQGSLIGDDPAVSERMLNLYTEIAYLPQIQRPTVNSPEFDEARARIALYAEARHP